jgi:hypothetical protein
MFKKVLKAYGLKRRYQKCSCGPGQWCQDCLIDKINPENTMLITGKSGDGSDAVILI